MAMALYALACLLGLPNVQAAGWDDFSNNLATDLAPFLSLFGEQVTKQYLSESTTMLDYFIFAMAPLGILTAIVSAIRVRGSLTLRAFIGRAQEGEGNAEAELCSSTSRNVCELYNNGGIARVFGRPKIIEIVHDTGGAGVPPPSDSSKKNAGIYTFEEYVTSGDKPEWKTEKKYVDDSTSESGRDVFAPNLSLNIGIKKVVLHPGLIAALGLLLQGGVLAYAAAVTYILRWDREDGPPESYACPLMIVGSLFVCGGIFQCAYLVGECTGESVFTRKVPGRSKIYWVQPGGQVLGDQTFEAFAYTDSGRLEKYTTSWKKKARRSQVGVWTAVCVTVSGFVSQFVGLRGIHSSISVAQLGAIMVMSLVRAGMRMRRLRPDDNLLAACKDKVSGHELDWLTFHIGGADLQKDLETDHHKFFWVFSARSREGDGIAKPPTDAPLDCNESNAAEKLLAYRSRLAQLTESPGPEIATTAPSEFRTEMVTVRRKAQQLAAVIEFATNTLSTQFNRYWRESEDMDWRINCAVSSLQDPPAGTSLVRKPSWHTLRLRMHRNLRNDPQGVGYSWSFQHPHELEAILGLWVWSLKSGPNIASQNPTHYLERPTSVNAGALRIISEKRASAEMITRLWLGGNHQAVGSTAYILSPEPAGGDYADIMWALNKKSHGDILEPVTIGPVSDADRNPTFPVFGWHAVTAPPSDNILHCLTTTNCPLLSLCGQEIFSSFFRSILGVVSDVGDIKVDQENQGFRLTNILISEIAEMFVRMELGSRDDALLCMLPPVVDQESRAGRGPLLYAARDGQEAAVEALLATEDIDANMSDGKGQTPLLQAAANGHEATVKLLLDEQRVDVHKVDKRGRSPLHIAAANGHGRVVELLLRDGRFDANKQDGRRLAPLSYAAANGHDVVVKQLLATSGITVDRDRPEESSPVWLAAANGREGVVRLLLEDGRADPYRVEKYREGRTPLSQAVKNGHEAVVRLLTGVTRQQSRNTATDSEEQYGYLIFFWLVRQLTWSRKRNNSGKFLRRLTILFSHICDRNRARREIKIAVIVEYVDLGDLDINKRVEVVTLDEEGCARTNVNSRADGTHIVQILITADPLAEIVVIKTPSMGSQGPQITSRVGQSPYILSI